MAHLIIGNRWYRFCYSLWSPFYDRLAGRFRNQRRRSIELLDLRTSEKVLIVGAGTGLDLDFVRSDVDITAIDLTPAMLARLKRRAARLQLNVDVRVMDGQALSFPDNSFDAVILHLIVSVIPDPIACVSEAARVLRPGGRAVIFDKFVPDRRKVPLLFKLVNPITTLLGTRINRQLGPILTGSGLSVIHEEPVLLGGLFKIVLLAK